ncbi:hypothetical protein B0T10DRAFT_501726 [Thelonectria olida]|uniref:DUF7730 domain-containing protein n=1 Tax=Thelonectria olida TaxID=1576542 RepID=A0A9P8VMW2_9HYPO|nr:hypothetical protein B0T10DRAFT_501726 [Thelonectria olida]
MAQDLDEDIGSNPYDTRSAVKDARTRALERLPRLPKPRPRQLTPLGFREGPTAAFQTCTYFRIPPDIRRHILRLAFGDRRIHMDLSYSHPDAPLATNRSTANHHCGIGSAFVVNKRERIVDDTQPECWHWWSSVCHRLPPGYESKSTGPMTYLGPNGPWADTCRLGQAEHCHSWPGRMPSKCRIGIMGWLLSCRQNYNEAIDVLYSTNTIVMTGVEMLTHLPELLLPQRLAYIASLEISWPLHIRFIDKSFFIVDEAHLKVILQHLATEFPRLRHLYLSLEESDSLKLLTERECVEVIERMFNQSTQWMSTLSECAIALPRKIFDSIFDNLAIVRDGTTARYVQSYHQIWRGMQGGMSLIRLPFVNSYPRPPYHLAQSSAQRTGYWLLHGSNEPEKPESPYAHTDGCMADDMNEFIDLDDFEFTAEVLASFDSPEN